MNIFTDILFLFLFILALFYFRLPNVLNNNYIIHKIYIFIAVFGFYYIMQMIKKVKSRCSIEPYNIVQKSFITALLCVIGYSIYTDLLINESTKDYFEDISLPELNINKRLVIITLIVVSFVMIMELGGVLFKTNSDECELTSYF